MASLLPSIPIEIIKQYLEKHKTIKQTLAALMNEKPPTESPPKRDISEMKFETVQEKQEMEEMISFEKQVQDLVNKSDEKSDTSESEEEQLVSDEETFELDDGTIAVIVSDENEDEYFNQLIEIEKKRDQELARVMKEQEKENELMILRLLEEDLKTIEEEQKLLDEFEKNIPKKNKYQPPIENVSSPSELKKKLQQLFRQAHQSSLTVEYVVNNNLLRRFKEKLIEIKKRCPDAKPQMVIYNI